MCNTDEGYHKVKSYYELSVIITAIRYIGASVSQIDIPSPYTLYPSSKLKQGAS